MKDSSFIFNRLILIGGPPRCGTTLMAKILNQHPRCMTAIDNTVYESWALYYYRLRIGLVKELQNRNLTSKEVQECLLRHLVRNEAVYGVASSDKIASYPLAKEPVPPNQNEPSQDPPVVPSLPRQKNQRWKRWWRRPKTRQSHLLRHCIPLTLFEKDFCLCLKSPEITFVLPELAESLPSAKFVLVYRPLIEIAESMYRKGSEWSLPSYHKRWIQELDQYGRLAPPPGVPEEWYPLWRTGSDFDRCVLYGASYLRALALTVPKIPATRVFVYDHAYLREYPSAVLPRLGGFLDLDERGFQKTTIREDIPPIPQRFSEEYSAIESKIEFQYWANQLSKLTLFSKGDPL